ncbi:MAG: flavin reductase family protein [Betaproteobacteria bacterium]|nr:flavin reductase family protein [Betaproteobacteria bacterium]
MQFDPDQLEERAQYKLMTGSIVPRPIALVTTLGPHGPNAAPFSLFNMVGTVPPMLMFSVGNQGDGTEKDTLQNVRHLPEFVVHICNEAIAERMNICATDYPTGVNELAEAGLTGIPSVKVRPPRIAEAPVQMECRLVKIVDFGTRHHVVFGEVVLFHYHEGIVDERHHVDLARLNPIGRLSGSAYTRVSEQFHMRRRFIRGRPKQLT